MATLSTAANPDCAGCWGILGDIQLNQKDYSQALEAYQQATLTDSSYWQWAAHSRMAKVYLARDELDLAIQELQLAIRQAEVLEAREIELSKLYTSLAELLVQDGRLNEAKEAYEKALQLEPTNQRAQEQLQRLIN
jgi:tetratricopeptide (TPR) repeat protein